MRDRECRNGVRSDDASRQSRDLRSAGQGCQARDDGPGEAIESRFDIGQGWIASSQVLLATTHDAALSDRGTHPAATLDAALLCPSTLDARTLPGCVFSAENFPLLRGDRRFPGIGSITQLPPK
jgi:hypothetical protein